MSPFSIIVQTALSVLMLVISAQTLAAPPFNEEGKVYRIDSQYINVNDRLYAISPTVKVFSRENKAINLSEVTSNELVSLRFIYLGNVKMVDEIHKIDALYEFPLPPGGRSN